MLVDVNIFKLDHFGFLAYKQTNKSTKTPDKTRRSEKNTKLLDVFFKVNVLVNGALSSIYKKKIIESLFLVHFYFNCFFSFGKKLKNLYHAIKILNSVNTEKIVYKI